MREGRVGELGRTLNFLELFKISFRSFGAVRCYLARLVVTIDVHCPKDLSQGAGGRLQLDSSRSEGDAGDKERSFDHLGKRLVQGWCFNIIVDQTSAGF